jgi:hypothetical protein
MTHRAVGTSIVAFCLVSFVSTILAYVLFGLYQVDLGAALVLLLGLRVAKGRVLAIKVSVLVMAAYTLVALLMITCALFAPSLLSAPPSLLSTPSGRLLTITSCFAGGVWAGLNAAALIRLLLNSTVRPRRVRLSPAAELRRITPSRILATHAMAVVAMVFLGLAAMVLGSDSLAEWLQWDSIPVLLFICAPIGGTVGVASSPIVALCLCRKDLRIAIPTVYGPSLAFVVLYVRLGPYAHSGITTWPLETAVPAFIAVCALSVLAYLVLPNRYDISPINRCPRCDYDLRGGTNSCCPECGWQQTGPPPGVA